MDIQQLSNDWLFQQHSEQEIKRWIKNLNYSYFRRAWGGHANDGDQFILTLAYKDKNDLLTILKKLDIKLNSIPEKHPKPIPGKSYTYAEHSVFKSEIKDFPEYEQPKHFCLNGTRCFCWIEKGNINFTFSGGQNNPYEVSETDFEDCKKLEELIITKGLTEKVSRECENLVTCISKTRYPHLFVD